MDFTLAHGTGNDFVVLVDLEGTAPVSAELARALCDRRTGLGADGVIRLTAAGAGADIVMDHRNADGSLAEMCGNGVRVVAKHVVDHGIVPIEGDVVRVATLAGVRAVAVERGTDGRVVQATVDMGPPELLGDESLALAEGALDVALVSMGNPHAVVVVDSVGTAAVATLGAEVEAHARFPERTNVEFVEVVDPATVRLRVFERGVGETAACGTGACAAVAALAARGLVGSTVAVHLPGGILTIARREDGHLTLRGPAVEVAHGWLDPSWSRAMGGA